MAPSRLTFIFVLNCIFLISINCNNDFYNAEETFYKPQIDILMNYINSYATSDYKYKFSKLINAQNKEDPDKITEITIGVDVLTDLDNIQTTKLECIGSVKYSYELDNFELVNALCNPITKTDNRQNEEITESTTSEEKYSKLQIVSEEPIVVSKAPCLGCLMDIDPTLISLNSLSHTILNHIESERNNKHIVLRVIRAQRQITSGVKYVLLLEIAPTDCLKTVEESSLDSCRLLTENSQICEVIFYQNPGFNRSKNIISNNCTSSQEFNEESTIPYPGNDQDNEIDKNYYPGKPTGYSDIVPTDDKTNYDSIAGNSDDMLSMIGGIMDSTRMKDLESQIIYMPSKVSTNKAETIQNHNTNEHKSAVEDYFDMMDDEVRIKRSTKNDNDNDSSSSSSSSSSSEENNNNNNNDDDDDDQRLEKTKRKTKKYKKDDNDDDDDDDNNDDDDSSSSSSSSEEDNNDDNKKRKSKKTKREVNDSDSSSSSSSSDEDNKREKRYAKNKKAKREINKSDSSESNETNEDKKLGGQNKISSEESSEEHRGGVRRKRSLVQSEQLIKTSPEEKNFVENLADFSASTLDDIDADNHKRIVLQILGSKKNYDGTLYYLTLRVGISKCPEEISVETDLQKPNRKDKECRNKLFENLTKICKVQLRVDNDKTNPKVEKSHCENIKKDQDDTNINRTNRSKRGGERLVGGIITVPADDEKIVDYSKKLLKEYDANEGLNSKRELIRVVSASRQLVSGTRYRIKIEFDENNKKTICDFDVWDRPWLKKESKEVKIDCEGQEQKLYRYRRSFSHDSFGKDDHDVHVGMFKNFMHKYNKKYSSKTEFKRRFYIFRENMKIIKNLNDNEQGTAKYGPTFFTDFTKDEFKRHTGLKPSLQDTNNIPMTQANIPNIDLPTEFDWRKKGVISEVKNQGGCGSCWAFSVTGNIEGLNAIKTGKMIELSEQELVDCDKLDDGCGGGLPDNAYRAIETLGGLESETDYPYEAENEKCHLNKSLTRVQISGAVNISSNEVDMAKWMVKNGPMSIGINANAMQFYMGGVSHPMKFLCNPKNLDHGVLIVGYGIHKYPLFHKSLPYWIVKNSWGKNWGEQGYYRVYRGDGTCGLNQMVSSAVL